jgi:hypothetical protein
MLRSAAASRMSLPAIHQSPASPIKLSPTPLSAAPDRHRPRLGFSSECRGTSVTSVDWEPACCRVDLCVDEELAGAREVPVPQTQWSSNMPVPKCRTSSAPA